jgi:hypothetical protein
LGGTTVVSRDAVIDLFSLDIPPPQFISKLDA